MNSCIYDCKINHVRMKPKKNIFSYSFFLAYIDLDELDYLSKNVKLFGYNKRNIFSFFDDDHFTFMRSKKKDAKIISREKISNAIKNYEGKRTKERIVMLIKELRLGFVPEKIFILTNLRNYNYVFNPVSFYYCFDKKGKFRALFSEVSNTFHDQKMYYLSIKDPNKIEFTDKQRKNFYISPFIDYDTDLHWTFRVPGEYLSMIIDSRRKDDTELRAVVVGKRKEITNSSIRNLIFRYPLITFMIIIWIHFQALKLWLKGVNFFNKKSTDKRIVESITKKK
jgi:uncharacterized protein